jgi:uncharacterized protein (TIGR03083 family)
MPDTPDLGLLYRASRLRIAEMVDDSNAGVRVPATPEWTVHDVVAHVAGIVEDVRNGNMEGVATDPWTAAQVERARHKSVSQLLAEWNEGAPMMEGFLSSPAGVSASRAVLDIHTHECDLTSALGRPLDLPGEFLDWMVPILLESFEAEAFGAGLPAVTVHTTPVEVFRGRLGRRTEAEVCAYGWSRDPLPYLSHWFVFGRAEHPLGERVA